MDGFRHTDLLKRLLPPEALDANGALLACQLEAEGSALDATLRAALDLAKEMEPDDASALLIDWERNYGLPDGCMEGEAQSSDQRRAALLAKITGLGGQSRAYFLQLAAALGYPGASISEFRPATCDDNCEAAVFGEDWRVVWRINLPQDTAVFIATCESSCDDPLQSWGNRQLECLLRRYKPADTTLHFTYGVA